MCYCVRKKQNETKCYRCTQMQQAGYFLACGIAMIILVSINFARIVPKMDLLEEWKDYASCVDTYMQITDW